MGKNNLKESEMKEMSLDVCLTIDACSYCGRGREALSFNITHNLIDMADAADIYQTIWCPEENGIKQAKQLIPILKKGIEKLRASPGEYRTYDSSNGWGTYDHFLLWLNRYLDACEEYPEATVSVTK